MSRLQESRDYFMKCLGFVLLLGFISLGAIGGCGNNDGNNGEEQDGTQALTENDFANDPTLRADPVGGVVVIFLEHPDSEEPDNDTGEVGNDITPYKYNEDLNHTYCFEDENDDAEHFAVLFDSDGNEVLRVEVNGECVTEFILAGDYFLEITHDGKIEEILPLFAIPGQKGEQAAQRGDTDQGLFKSAKSQFSKILNNLHNIITQKAKAQSVTQNVSMLLSSKMCEGCDLEGADLTFAFLMGANLNGANLANAKMNPVAMEGATLACIVDPSTNMMICADLTKANLAGASLSDVDLTGADLTGANLFGLGLTNAILTQAVLSDATMTQVDLTGADLTGATLSGLDLTQTNLTGANLIGNATLTGVDLTGAHLGNANLTDADLSGANLTNAILTAVNLFDANLNQAVLNGANLEQANISDASMTQAVLNGADLTGAALNGTDLTGSDLSDAKLPCTPFGPRENQICVNLTGANLNGANLTNADLSGAFLSGVNFTNANLNGANLSGTLLGGAIWCDGNCICGPNSFGSCDGCASQDTCTGI